MDQWMQDIRYAFRWITPGTFFMGSPENEPERFDRELQHQVTLTKGFWLGETTVTQALWQAVMGEKPSDFQGEERPVESVNWEDTQQFIQTFHKINARLGLRLPTEAEWEYACRAGTTTPFHFGNQITTDQVNYDGNLPYDNGEKGEYREQTMDVRALPCNPWGVWQMHGNVWEWVADCWTDSHAAAPPETCQRRVLKGGAWNTGGWRLRAGHRIAKNAAAREYDNGFRVARDLP